jgi:hypothetical protein
MLRLRSLGNAGLLADMDVIGVLFGILHVDKAAFLKRLLTVFFQHTPPTLNFAAMLAAKGFFKNLTLPARLILSVRQPLMAVSASFQTRLIHILEAFQRRLCAAP